MVEVIDLLETAVRKKYDHKHKIVYRKYEYGFLSRPTLLTVFLTVLFFPVILVFLPVIAYKEWNSKQNTVYWFQKDTVVGDDIVVDAEILCYDYVEEDNEQTKYGHKFNVCGWLMFNFIVLFMWLMVGYLIFKMT